MNLIKLSYESVKIPKGILARLSNDSVKKYAVLNQKEGNGKIWHYPTFEPGKLNDTHKVLATVKLATFNMKNLGCNNIGSGFGLILKEYKNGMSGCYLENGWIFNNLNQIKEFFYLNNIFQPQAQSKTLTEQFSGKLICLIYAGNGISFDSYLAGVGVMDFPEKQMYQKNAEPAQLQPRNLEHRIQANASDIITQPFP
jgi:hypothetical protein